MFDLEPGKLIVIAIVALIAIPSKDLPRVLRSLGQFTGKMRRMAAEFQGQFMEAMREADLDDLRKEVGEMRDAVKESVKLDGAFDPMAEARKQITGAIRGESPSHPRLRSAARKCRSRAGPDRAASRRMRTRQSHPSRRRLRPLLRMRILVFLQSSSKKAAT